MKQQMVAGRLLEGSSREREDDEEENSREREKRDGMGELMLFL